MASNPLTMEYGVVHFQSPFELHRGPWLDETPALDWVIEAEKEGFEWGTFYVVKRVVTSWQRL